MNRASPKDLSQPAEELGGNSIDGEQNVTQAGAGVTKRGISCLYTNARSLINKLDIYRAEVTEKWPDIIGITETWAKEKVNDAEFNFNDAYKIYRQDRLEIKGGG